MIQSVRVNKIEISMENNNSQAMAVPKDKSSKETKRTRLAVWKEKASSKAKKAISMAKRAVFKEKEEEKKKLEIQAKNAENSSENVETSS